MWLSFLENPEMIQAIYEDEIPSLENVFLREIKIITGEDIQCQLKVDLKEMPRKKPAKWIEKKANTVQLEVLLIKTEILFLDFKGGFHSNNIEISMTEDNKKKVSCSVNGEDSFVLVANWLHLQSIVAY